jgi:hypothetical protein
VALARLKTLRHELDAEQHPGPPRNLQLVVDGRFTNAKLLKNLPHHTTLIGRIRRDAKLFFLPQTQGTTGRKRIYGQQAPTPQELLADPCIEFQNLQARLSDRPCHFRVKSLGPLRAMQAGGGHQLQLLVIAPLGYRLRKGSKLLYRQPAFLICTDPSLSIDSLLQSYLWRWDIEVNFRDQKSLHRETFRPGRKGDVLTVEFTVMGIPCLGLNGGPAFKHNEAFSFQVATADLCLSYVAHRTWDPDRSHSSYTD